MDLASLGIKIDSSQAKTAFADLEKVAIAGDKAEKSVGRLEGAGKRGAKGLSETEKAARAAAKAQEANSKSIDQYVQKLQTTAKTNGTSARETKLYELAVRGASAAQLQAADSAIRMNEAYQKGIQIGDKIKAGLLTIGAAAVTGFIAGAAAVDHLIKKAGDFQDLAEKTGDSAENIASLAVAAGTANTPMSQIADFAVKIAKNLTGVDDESKAAGAAITALGLDLESFKRLKPADQIEALGKALNSFNDGPTKGAAIEALARGSADLLPFLKEIGAEGGRQVILTQEQIRLADEYADKQAKSRAQLALYAEALATQAIPALSAFQDGLSETVKGLIGVDKSTGVLSHSNELRDFADASAIAIARLVDGLYDAGKALYALKGSLNVVAADITVLGEVGKKVANPFGLIGGAVSGNEDLKKALAERNGILSDANKRYEALQTGLGLADKVRSQIANRQFSDPRRLGDPGSIAQQAKGDIQFDGKTKKDKVDKTASQEAKAQLAFDIEEIKKANEQLVGIYSNAERIIEAQRSAGLLDEREYYAAKLGLLNLNNQAQTESLSKELERLQAEKLAGKDKIDNDRKIVDIQAKLTKARQDGATAVEVLAIQEQAASKKLAQYYRDAEAAAQSYLDTIRRAQARELSGFGQGTQERDRTAGRAQIEDRFDQQRRDLEKSRRDAELNGTFGTDAQAKYNDELDRIRRFQSTALSEYDAFFAARLSKEKDFQLGASEALKNYYTDAKNVYKQTEDAVTNAFKGMEDALVSFVTTGKLDFKSLAQSIIADIARIIVKQQISNALGLAGGAGGSGLGGLFSSLFSGGGSSIGNMGASSLIPGFANGGSPAVGKVAVVGERGPELFIPRTAGTIVSNEALASGGGNGPVSVQVNVDASGSSVEGNSEKSALLGKQFVYAVEQVLVKNRAPGGLLASV